MIRYSSSNCKSDFGFSGWGIDLPEPPSMRAAVARKRRAIEAKDRLRKLRAAIRQQCGLRPRESWRKEVIRRYGLTCQLCGLVSGRRMSQVVAHHMAPYARHPELSGEPNNGITVCKRCHRWLHSAAGEAKRARLEREALERFGYDGRKGVGEGRAVQLPLFWPRAD